MSNGQQGIWVRFSPIIGMVVYFLSGIGILAYIIHYIISLANKEQITSPIDVAAIAATLGGLILLGAFYKDRHENATEEEKKLSKGLKSTAKYLLSSSVFFIIAFFLMEEALYLDSPTPQWIITLFAVFADIIIAIAGVSLALALGRLVMVIPRL